MRLEKLLGRDLSPEQIILTIVLLYLTPVVLLAGAYDGMVTVYGMQSPISGYTFIVVAFLEVLYLRKAGTVVRIVEFLRDNWRDRHLWYVYFSDMNGGLYRKTVEIRHPTGSPWPGTVGSEVDPPRHGDIFVFSTPRSDWSVHRSALSWTVRRVDDRNGFSFSLDLENRFGQILYSVDVKSAVHILHSSGDRFHEFNRGLRESAFFPRPRWPSNDRLEHRGVIPFRRRNDGSRTPS